MTTNVETDPMEQEFARRACQAMVALQDCVEVDAERLGGVPVLRGTRFSVPQLFAELADSDAVPELAANFELDPALLQKFLHALAVYLDKPISP